VSDRATIAVVTGTRAEFGLLRSTMRAIDADDSLTLRVVVAGSHFLKPAETWREVAAEFEIAGRVEMQRDDERRDRLHDAIALGRGVEGFARVFADLDAQCVLVLGDRIEAFGAASAASVMGLPVAHVHGGDRAEGVADEAMRHAITKLAHIHLPATRASADRIVRMGESAERVHVVGSPAIDGLSAIHAMGDREFESMGSPQAVFCLHPIGRSDDEECADARAVLEALRDRRVVALMPNHDAGRGGIVRAIEEAERAGNVRVVEHLARDRFVALCKRVAREGGVIVGNSSAGLIECAALDPALPCVNVGPRQSGRERPSSVVDSERIDAASLARALDRAGRVDRAACVHPYGDGRAGERIASILRDSGLGDAIARRGLVRKRNAY
jgi:UDP-hydrolysing UDP-N-acetyl-D-glucosamine 2-epimerase